jgi:hypothetical protein
MRSTSATLLTLLALLAHPAASKPAHAICWIEHEEATTADGFPVTSPRVAGMRAAAHTLQDVLQSNPKLEHLPEVRLRSSWRIEGKPDQTNEPYRLRYRLEAHGPQAWAGACDLLPQTDGFEPLATVVVDLNSVDSALTQRATTVRDAQLQAFVEPEQVGRLGEHVLYGGQWIVLTFDGNVPWVPVTMAEYLDFEERRLVAAEAETEQKNEKAWNTAEQLDADGIRDTYENVRRLDPEQAEKFRTLMDESRRLVESEASVNKESEALAQLRKLRSSLSTTELAAQAREGYVSSLPASELEGLPRLVKLDPALPWDRNPNRIHLMEIHFSGRGEPYESLMRDAVEALDWKAIESLMR